MRLFLIGAVALVLALAVQPVRAADWSIEVVPESSGKSGLSISLSNPFQVVLTNRTDHDLTVWKEWCSDGYFNLSFVFTGKDGQVIRVWKTSRDWAKNFPDPLVVGAGKHFVLTVTLKAETWQGTENLVGSMTMQAIYENTNSPQPFWDPKSLIRPAWVGKIESEPIQVTVWR